MAGERGENFATCTLVIFSIVGVGLPLVLQSVALGIDQWHGQLDFLGYGGIWKLCELSVFKVCLVWSLGDVPGWLTAVRVLECLGLAGLVIAGIVYIVHMFWYRTNRKSLCFAIALEGLAGLFILIGSIIYGRSIECEDDASHVSCLGYSFILACHAGAISIILAVIIFARMRRARLPTNIDQYTMGGQNGPMAAYGQTNGYQQVLQFEPLPNLVQGQSAQTSTDTTMIQLEQPSRGPPNTTEDDEQLVIA